MPMDPRFRHATRDVIAADSSRGLTTRDLPAADSSRGVTTRDLPAAEANAHDQAGGPPDGDHRDRHHRDGNHRDGRDGQRPSHRSPSDGNAPPQPRSSAGAEQEDADSRAGAAPAAQGKTRRHKARPAAGAEDSEGLRSRGEKGKRRESVEYFDRRGTRMKAILLGPDEAPRERSSSSRRHHRHHHERAESHEENVEPAGQDYDGPVWSRGPGPASPRAQYARPDAGVYDVRAYPRPDAGVYDVRAYAGVYDDHAYFHRPPAESHEENVEPAGQDYDGPVWSRGPGPASPRAQYARPDAGVYDVRAYAGVYDDHAYFHRPPRLYDARQYPQGLPRAYDDRRSPGVWDAAAMTWARVPGSSSPHSPRFGSPPPAPPSPASPRRSQSWYPFAALDAMMYPQGLAADWMPTSLQRPSRQQTILPLSGLGARSARIGSPVLRAEGDRRMTKKLSEDILREREFFSLKNEATYQKGKSQALKSEVDQHNRFLYDACGALQKQVDVMYERISDLRSKSPENQVAAALEGQIDAISQQIDVIYQRVRVSDKRRKSAENDSADALQDQINAMSKRVSDLAIYATNEQGLSTCSIRGLLQMYADNRTCIVHTYRICRGLPRHSVISHTCSTSTEQKPSAVRESWRRSRQEGQQDHMSLTVWYKAGPAMRVG
jgi:hypothetical protein